MGAYVCEVCGVCGWVGGVHVWVHMMEIKQNCPLEKPAAAGVLVAVLAIQVSGPATPTVQLFF